MKTIAGLNTVEVFIYTAHRGTLVFEKKAIVIAKDFQTAAIIATQNFRAAVGQPGLQVFAKPEPA